MARNDDVPTRSEPARGVGSLVSKAGLVTVGNLLFAALGFVSNWILARALGEGDFAVVARALAAFAICQDLLGKSLCWALVRIASQHERERGAASVAEVVLTARRMHAGFGALLFCSYGPLAFWGATWSRDSAAWEGVFLLAAGVSAWFTNFGWHALTVCQLREDWRGYATLTVGGAGIRLAGYGMLWVTATLSVPSAVAMHVVTSMLTALWSLRYAELRIPTRGVRVVDAAEVRRTLGRYAFPVVVATTLGTVATQVDVFLVSSFRANATVSHFRVAALVVTALELGILAAIVVLAPGAGRAFSASERRSSLARSFTLSGIVGGLALVTWPLAKWIVSPFGPEYAPAADYYTILLIGTVLTALTHPLSVSFFSEDRPGRFVWVHGVSLVFLVGADLLVLEEHGALGAAWVRVGMRAVQAAIIVLFLGVDLARARRAGATLRSG